MMKIIHLSFIFLSVSGFIVRVILSETHPRLLKLRGVKIMPHVIDTLLLISGLILVYQGNWLSMRYGWIIAKLVGLLGYIGFGVIAMRQRGAVKWLAFAAALAFLVYIARVAVTKQIGLF